MISTEIIDKEFDRMIHKERIHRKLGMDSSAVTQVRWKLKHGKPVSLDYKIKLLQRSGHRFDLPKFTHKQVVDAIKFALRTSEVAREMGAEYVMQKWLSQ
jgi:hypothetical protein